MVAISEEVVALSDKIAIPAGANEYFEGVHKVIMPLLEEVMRSADKFSRCSVDIDRELFNGDIPEESYNRDFDTKFSTAEAYNIHLIANAIGTAAGRSVFERNSTATQIYKAIQDLAIAIRDLKPVTDERN